MGQVDMNRLCQGDFDAVIGSVNSCLDILSEILK